MTRGTPQQRRLEQKTRSAVTGALDRASRTRRPRRIADVDWDRTIRANLRHYQPDLRTIVAETLIGYGRRQQAIQRDVVLCVDQSGSMASSVVYSSVFAAVLASLRSLRTSLVVFDMSIVDLTPELSDPVEVLFGTQLGGERTSTRRSPTASSSCSGRPTPSSSSSAT